MFDPKRHLKVTGMSNKMYVQQLFLLSTSECELEVKHFSLNGISVYIQKFKRFSCTMKGVCSVSENKPGSSHIGQAFVKTQS